MATVNVVAFGLLVSMGKEAGPAAQARDEARAKLQGAYDLGVQAAIECGNVETFIATIEKLEDDIRHNRDRLAIRFKAKPRKEASDTGEKYLVPSSVSTVKAALKFAFEHGVPLVNSAGEPDTFGNIRKANAATRANLDKAKGATLKGDDLARWQIQHGARALLEKAAKLEGADLAAAVKAIAPWIPKVQTAAQPTDELAEAAEHKPARTRGRHRKSQTEDGSRKAA
jgi:hypothetical protein